MRLQRVALYLVLSLFMEQVSFGESVQESIGPEEHAYVAPFKAKATTIVDLIGKENNKLGFGVALPLNPRVQIYYDEKEIYHQVPAITLKDVHNGYSLEFLQPTRQLISFQNNHISDELFDIKKGKLYDHLTVPQWTPEHAIEIGKKFLSLVFDRKDVMLGKPYAKYIHQFHQLPKHYTGFWIVGWDRVDAQGHVFVFTPTENIWFDIDESRGVFGAFIQLPASYQEQPGTLLKSADLLDKAQKAAEETTVWPPAAQWFQNGKIEQTPRSVALQVISPNHLLTSKDMLLKHDLDARLAWVFAFAWHPNDDPKQVKPIWVWMDAHTGEYLGGDLSI